MKHISELVNEYLIDLKYRSERVKIRKENMVTHSITHEVEVSVGCAYISIPVEFTGEIEQEDSSFSYSYGSISGTTPTCISTMCGNLTWDKSKHTEEENQIIEDYLKDGKITLSVYTKEGRTQKSIRTYDFICDEITEDYNKQSKYEN